MPRCTRCRLQWLHHEVISTVEGPGVHWNAKHTANPLFATFPKHATVTPSALPLGLAQPISPTYFYYIRNSFVRFTAIHFMNKSGTTGIWLIPWTRTLFDHSREEYDYLCVSKHREISHRGKKTCKSFCPSLPLTSDRNNTTLSEVWVEEVWEKAQCYCTFSVTFFQVKPTSWAPEYILQILFFSRRFPFLGSTSHLKQLEILE